jgi:hypothetical protein
MRKRLLSLSAVLALVGATSVLVTSPAAAATVGNEAALRAAFASDAAVDLSADITLTDCSGPDGGSVVRPDTNSDPVTLDGHGFTITQTCTAAVLIQHGAGAFTLRNVTITGGTTVVSGAGVYAQSDLTVESSVITNNHADEFGGGLVTAGVLVVRASSIVGNGSGKGGGGVAGALDITITDSDVSENFGGGITTLPDASAHITVINSTVHHNTRTGLGGGIFSGGDATLVYVTLTDNAAAESASAIDALRLFSFGSVITNANFTGQANCLAGPASVSLGYNFSDDPSCKLTAPTDRQDAGDPHLEPLAANGGPTMTRLPQPGSPLLDAIPAEACAAGVTTDQRGVTRPQGGKCDIGAVEVAVLVVSEPEPEAPEPAASIVATPRFTG